MVRLGFDWSRGLASSCGWQVSSYSIEWGGSLLGTLAPALVLVLPRGGLASHHGCRTAFSKPVLGGLIALGCPLLYSEVKSNSSPVKVGACIVRVGRRLLFKLLALSLLGVVAGSCTIKRNSPGPEVHPYVESGFYYVLGDGVANPGRFVYRDHTTLRDAIKAAGGFCGRLSRSRVELVHADGNIARFRNAAEIDSGKNAVLTIAPGDRLDVSQVKAVPQAWWKELQSVR